MELVWFRGQKWIRESLKIGKPYVVFGKANWFSGKYSMPHPEIELQTEQNNNLRSAMQAIYPSTEKLSNKGITNRVVTKIMQQLFLETNGRFIETLSDSVKKDLKLISKSDALFNIHFPKTPELLAKAQFRLKFEELFYIQLQLILKNLIHKSSGKTIVAFMSILMGLDNGFQCCLMAPTAILSVQHYNGLQELCKPLNISISLLTGSSKTSERREIHENLENGNLQILIGTHALLEDKVKFKNLGLAIIDEQHRFGVAQRSKLWHKKSL